MLSLEQLCSVLLRSKVQLVSLCFSISPMRLLNSFAARNPATFSLDSLPLAAGASVSLLYLQRSFAVGALVTLGLDSLPMRLCASSCSPSSNRSLLELWQPWSRLTASGWQPVIVSACASAFTCATAEDSTGTSILTTQTYALPLIASSHFAQVPKIDQWTTYFHYYFPRTFLPCLSLPFSLATP